MVMKTDLKNIDILKYLKNIKEKQNLSIKINQDNIYYYICFTNLYKHLIHNFDSQKRTQ